MADTAAAAVEVVPPPATASKEDRIRRIFLDFMTKVAQFEELVDAGKRLLVKFHQELEYLRRPQLPKESGSVSEIVKSNYTDRMKSYLEAGCSLHHQNIQNINQLQSSELGLEDHINRAKTLLEEIKHLRKDAHGIALAANLSVLRVSDNCCDGDNLVDISCSMEDGEQPVDELDSTVSFVSVMILVHNMLKLDYTMQEKIVKALSLKTSSSELEGYCLMWDLRPYINDNVMHLAWKFVPYKLCNT